MRPIPILLISFLFGVATPGILVAQTAATSDYGQSSATGGHLPFLPLAPFANSFDSTSGSSRGFWFRSPTSCVITGLSVENEANRSRQSAALFVFGSAPPVYPAFHYTTASEVRAFVLDAAANTVQSFAPVVVRAGDYVAVLGGTGDGVSSTLTTSYSLGVMRSNVLGFNVVARRILTQNILRDNIAKGAGLGVATEGVGDGPCGRVRLYVSGQDAYGPAPHLVAATAPALGGTAKLDLHSGIASPQIGLLLMAGGRLPGIPTPYGNLNITLPFFITLPVPLGNGSASIPIPNDDKLAGVIVDWQGVVLDFATPLHGMSNGIEWRLGK
ncbi:MAG: hypothetical protein H6832_17770 [Planctomycetes bacterium]|nr:hypothetical protein [Planctomycetota bacterium]MCB9920255.1 hypothetical protein [Planctomycetota bacterium]